MKKILLFLMAFSFAFIVKAQKSDIAIATKLVAQNSKALGLTENDLQHYIVSNSYNADGTQYVYLLQEYKGLPVFNQMLILAFKNGEVVSNAGVFIGDMDKASKGYSASPSISAASAVAFAFHEAKVAVPAFLKTPFVTDNGRKNDFGAVSGVTENVKTELMWIPVENGKQTDVKLAWQVQVVPAGTADYWLIQVDAKDGRIIKKINLTVYDSWEKKNSAGILRAPKTTAKTAGSEWTSPFGNTSTFSPQIVGTANYTVIPWPAESPIHPGGAPAIRTNPWTAAAGNASTLGWHSDGTTDYTITRGNNVWATEDRSASNQNSGQPGTSTTSPDPLNFNFTPNFNVDPTTNPMQAFCITNLFYWNNLMHDMSYQYGFTETAANFQKNNLGRGGNQGDDVIALAQSGAGTNNANFSTPADGGRGRMRMYLFDAVSTTKVHVNAPAPIVGDYAAIEGNFSTANLLVNVGPVTANCAYWTDGALSHEACVVGNTPSSSVAGKIVLIDRGNCNFTEKILNAQNAGAVGVIMLQIPGGTNAPNPIIMGGTDNTITIPAVMVSVSNAATFVAQVTNGLNVTLSSSVGQLLDGDLDAGVMCHEYTHGISNRMTGGGTGTCLSNAEEGGEGWSDYFGLMMTTNWATATVTDGTIPRAVGNYVTGQNATSGLGIRNYPYSTNIVTNPLTYANVGTGTIGTEVHNIGEVWCMAIWEMTWAVIQQENSINPNLYNYTATGTGGNSIALKLVLEGFRLQPCSPGFIDGRDAILRADRNLYAGRHACAIWTAFAKRGMGFAALQGSSLSATDQTASTTMPPAPTISTQPVDVSVAAAANATFTASAGTNVNLIYRWQVSTDNGTNWNDVSPAVITPTLTLTAVTSAMNGYKYRAIVSIGCATTTTNVATLTVTGASVPTLTLTSATGTNAQTVCINTAIAPITYSVTGGATSASVTGLPSGVTGTFAAGVFTISGTPTAAGTFTYTVTSSGGTPNATATGTITVNPLTTMTLTSAAGTNSQSVAVNTPITNIVYTTGSGATGATVTGLPAGVTGVYSGGANGTVTISGTPTTCTGSPFSYTVTTTGGCGTVTLNGTITVNCGPSVTLSSAAGTNAQTVCINTAITTITYTTAGGVTGATVTGLPTGVTGVYSGGTNGTVTISGTPTTNVGSPFTYTVTTSGGSSVATATGTITVNGAATVTLSSAAGTNAQTVCANTAITNITYTTTGGVTGATVTGLPTGVTSTFSGSTVTISGTPTAAGTFNYTVTTVGGCGSATATGTITVNPGVTLTLSSGAGSNNQTKCINTALTAVTYTTAGGVTGATVTGLPTGTTGTYSGGTNGTITISGTPTVSGTFTFTVTTAGGCAPVTATGTIIVNPVSTITLSSAAGTAAQTVCINTAITNITYTVNTGVTGATVTGLPAGVAGTFAGSTFTISGTPTATGTFTYTVTATGGCTSPAATGTITVNPASTITLTSAAATTTQTVCGGSPITAITYATGAGATSATATGLPAGVTGVYNAGVFTISGTPTVSGAFTYTVSTSGGCGTATATGTITAGAAPVITGQPVSITSCSTSATFTVTATGAGLTYQWQVSTDGGVTWNNILGATSATLTLNGLTPAQGANRYRVRVTGSCGSTISNVVSAQVGTPPVVVLTAAPTVVYNPSAQGGGLFTTVSPVGNYVYQWKRNGIILPTVLGPSISNQNGLLYDFGTYQVSVIDVATGCTGVSNQITIVDDAFARNHLFISPSPATDFVNVSYFSSTVAAQARTLELYDGKGARLMIKDYSTVGIYGTMKVDISKFVAGTYMIVLRDAAGKKIASDRFVKY